MGIYLAEQTMLFMQAVLLGAALGLLYDALRITRLAIPTKSVVIFLEDVLYFFFAGVCTFFFLMQTIEGRVRFFIFIGEGLGAVLYFLTLSPLIMKISQTIIKVIAGIIRTIIRWLILPIAGFILRIVLFIFSPVIILGRFIKKSVQRCNYRLKVRSKLLYNQLGSVFALRKRKNKRKSQSHDPQKAKKARKKRTKKKLSS